MKNLKKILNDLDIEDPLYKQKLEICYLLTIKPNVGHIISRDLLSWAEENKFKTQLHQQDHCDWWTVSLN